MLEEFLKHKYNIQVDDELVLFFSNEKLCVKEFVQLVSDEKKEEKLINDIKNWQLKDRFSVLAYLGATATWVKFEKVQ